jgi:hypothetical protein
MESSILRHLRQSVFLIIAGFAIASCGGGSDPGPPATGKVAVLFTDGPDERFEQILITLDRMLLLGGDGGHQIVYDGPEITFDLLDLRGRADFAFASEIIADDYSKIRLEVTKIELVDIVDPMEPPSVTPVDLPANGKIDLNPQGPFRVLPGQTTVIELDMDANRSFHPVEQGNGDYRLRPVIFVNVYPDNALLGDRLVRVFGRVDSVVDNSEEKSALVCGLYFVPQLGDAVAGDPDDCVRIFANEMPGIFGENGAPANFQDIVPMTSKLTGIGFVRPDGADVLFELQAVVMEIGEHKPPSATGWETLRGSVEPDVACDIPDAPDTFCFQPNDAATPIKTQLQAETRIFDTDGMPSDINEMDTGTVDGLRITNGTEELRASLVVLSADPDPGLVSGVVEMVEIDLTLPEGTFDVLTLDTAAKVCVNEETDVLRILVDDGVVTIVDLLDPQVLVLNMDTVEATGTPSVVGDTGCDLIADVVIVDSL